ncbi:MAG: hypothetical protein HY842_10320 [Bacteroidetes bacterium]|nr:hypothetical protein [Bacteroidota bacterium]
MKTSTRFTALVTLLSVCSVLHPQTDPILTLVTTLNPKAATQLVFEPAGILDLTYWNQEHIELTIRVENNGLRREQVKALVPLGLFRPETTMDGSNFLLKMPGLERGLLINGNEISWQLHYVMKSPHTIQVVRKNATAPTHSNLD